MSEDAAREKILALPAAPGSRADDSPSTLPESSLDQAPQDRLDQTQAPLLETLGRSANRPHAAFYAPGHKRGQGTPEPLRALLGESALAVDLPELPELDNLFAPEGAIAQAQALAAAAFGSEQTYFLVNGSTCGIEAAMLAVCRPGEKVVVARNAHQSVISALIVTGATPVWVQPEYDPAWDLAGGVRPDAVAAALRQHPDSRAVLVVSPTYQGICSDLFAIAAIAHRYGVPLLVDEAHGPHFAFHPDLPPSALEAGADLAVQSTHKVLSALTQASMLHVQGDRICRQRLRRALQITQSTSPSYLLLASLDAARQQMALGGHHLLSQTLALALAVRSQLTPLPGIRVCAPSASALAKADCRFDLTRLTVDVSGLGLSGFEADEILHEELGVTAELPTLRQLTFILSLGNTAADMERLTQAFTTLSQRPRSAPAAPAQLPPLAALPLPPMALTPRDAFFATAETVPRAAAVGRLSAATLCPYPPGIPLLLPGEVITAEALQSLQQVHQAGGYITGAVDPTLATLSVIRACS